MISENALSVWEAMSTSRRKLVPAVGGITKVGIDSYDWTQATKRSRPTGRGGEALRPAEIKLQRPKRSSGFAGELLGAIPSP